MLNFPLIRKHIDFIHSLMLFNDKTAQYKHVNFLFKLESKNNLWPFSEGRLGDYFINQKLIARKLLFFFYELSTLSIISFCHNLH